jgi:NADH:ubiquinone oxidoreductase subunit 5 (subunit L)/multisubunit Na+/H+ antiporter MnhA subunit
MAWVFTILGILSIVGGFVMLPGFIAPFAPFKEFLDPVFNSPQTQQVAAAVLQNDQTEAYFGGLSLLMVALGWLLADLTYRRKQLSAERMAAAFGGLLYRLSLNKYYVDEAYDALFVRPYIALTRATAWFDLHIIDGLVNLSATLTVFGSWLSGLFDNYIVDGLVNLTANATLTAGSRLRRLQTGSINGYLYGILAAVMLILLVRAILRA